MGSSILFLIIGIAAGIAIGYFFLKASVLKDSMSKSDIDERYILKELYNETGDRLKRAEEDLGAAAEKTLDLSTRIATLTNEKENLNQQFGTFKKEIESLHVQSQQQFENLAAKILDEKSKKFVEQNQQNMGDLLNPLRERIIEFQNKVDKTYNMEAAERNTLKGEIKQLVELNRKISQEANNLASALKGDSKKQGNWGEIILEKVLERSGLEKGREYEVQYSINDGEGNRQQPDVIIFLPDNKHIIVDSKVSLTAYEAFINAAEGNEEEKQMFLLRHITSVKKHIDELGKKNYQLLQGLNTPDFVLLFMPIESSFSIAIQADNELFNYAWDRKIVIVSPSTLLATLHTIASMWKQEKQAKHVFEIAEESGKLYDKFCGLIEDLILVGKRMESAKQSYDEAMKKASTGPGNIVRRVEKIKELGAKTTKTLPNSLISRSADE
ncbi:MAG TPA: DNA recombination protein RmuC [Bacteroidia bacterium]|jgi:DNA recombination protein RmuC|nr:DNA recombination protein RmuC [Bacteroidia bacterium]